MTETETRQIAQIEGLSIVRKLRHHPPFSGRPTERAFGVVVENRIVQVSDVKSLLATVKGRCGLDFAEICHRNPDAVAKVVSDICSLGAFDDHKYMRSLHQRLVEQLGHEPEPATYSNGVLTFSVERGDTLLLRTFWDTYELDGSTLALRLIHSRPL